MASAESKSFRNEHLLILLFCVAAALRVFIFSAAFPFFSNIDEDLHFDLIMQYSHAQIPRSFDRLKEETLNWIVPYASPEFLFPPEQFLDGKFPAPLWKEPWSKVELEIAATRAAWSSEINFQSSQPPLYYALASAWWWIGKHFGLAGLQSLYWIRFLNVPLVAMMVWLGYVTARTIAPGRMDLCVGVPLLLAFVPQNVFYTVNNDVLSPLCFGALISCAAIPVGTWMLWTKFHFGDLSGSTAKIGLLGWTRKPFGDWWQHPIFTPRGVWIFWSDLIASFWRGEVSWHSRPLRWRG